MFIIWQYSTSLNINIWQYSTFLRINAEQELNRKTFHIAFRGNPHQYKTAWTSHNNENLQEDELGMCAYLLMLSMTEYTAWQNATS